MNWQTAVGTAIVAGVFIAIVVRMIVNKKKGKNICSCGGGCGSCPMGDKCRKMVR